MLGWWKRRKLVLVGISGWTITWTDIGEKEGGKWLYFESSSGRRKIETTRIPYWYKGLGGKTRIPGYSEAIAWQRGGPRPRNYLSINKEIQ